MNRLEDRAEQTRHEADTIDDHIQHPLVEHFRDAGEQPQRIDDEPQVKPVELQALVREVV